MEKLRLVTSRSEKLWFVDSSFHLVAMRGIPPRRFTIDQLAGRLPVSQCANVLRDSFDDEHRKDHRVWIVDVEHQACDGCEHDPLHRAACFARLVPIPKKQRDTNAECDATTTD